MRKKLNTTESLANWSDLPPEMLVEIAIKLKVFEDFTAVRGVCKSWRDAAPKDIFKGPKLPLLMLSDINYRNYEFYNLSTNKIRKAAVPEAEGKRCTDARFGWILAVAPYSGESYLFKPFSSSPTIPLPNFHSFATPRKFDHNPNIMIVKNAILSADPSDTSDFMVFVLMDPVLGFLKNGDENWTRIESECDFTSIGYCSNQLYAADSIGHLWSLDPSATHLTSLLKLNRLSSSRGTPHVIESTAGELAIVVRRDFIVWSDPRCKAVTEFEAIRMDALKGEWKVISGGMEKNAIFIAQNAAVSVSVDDFPGVIKPYSVYFTSPGQAVGIFNFKDKTTEWLDDIPAFCSVSMWVFP